MVTLPLADCSRMLGIHPKTLHHWLKQANVPFVAHPTDARIKSLTLEHVEQLARLHRRPLQSLASAAPALPEATPVLSVFEGQATSSQESEAAHLQAPPAVPTSFPQQADLIQKLSCLETKVATLEEHLTQLALALLQEREHALERRLTALETAMHERVGRPLCPPPLPDREVTLPDKERAVAPQIVRQPGPAEQRARSRMPPLIEYSPAGSYVSKSSAGRPTAPGA